MRVPLNTGLLRHWENWITVFLMVLIAGIAFDQAAALLTSRKDLNNGG